MPTILATTMLKYYRKIVTLLTYLCTKGQCFALLLSTQSIRDRSRTRNENIREEKLICPVFQESTLTEILLWLQGRGKVICCSFGNFYGL